MHNRTGERALTAMGVSPGHVRAQLVTELGKGVGMFAQVSGH